MQCGAAALGRVRAKCASSVPAHKQGVHRFAVNAGEGARATAPLSLWKGSGVRAPRAAGGATDKDNQAALCLVVLVRVFYRDSQKTRTSRFSQKPEYRLVRGTRYNLPMPKPRQGAPQLAVGSVMCANALFARGACPQQAVGHPLQLPSPFLSAPPPLNPATDKKRRGKSEFAAPLRDESRNWLRRFLGCLHFDLAVLDRDFGVGDSLLGELLFDLRDLFGVAQVLVRRRDIDLCLELAVG